MILRANALIPVQNTPSFARLERITIKRNVEPVRPQVRVASTLAQAMSCWRLVYEVYLRSEFIFPNAFGIHTSLPATRQDSTVFFDADEDGVVQSTVTAIMDGPLGLPLDEVYGEELDALRREGRRLSEVGLLADRRQLAKFSGIRNRVSRCEASEEQQTAAVSTRPSLVDQMRYVFNYARKCQGITDHVIGVHPKHARFYARAFGFEVAGPARTYAAVNDRPVILLRGEIDKVVNMDPMPFAVRYDLENPVDTAFFECRYRHDDVDNGVLSSQLNEYLACKSQMRVVAG